MAFSKTAVRLLSSGIVALMSNAAIACEQAVPCRAAPSGWSPYLLIVAVVFVVWIAWNRWIAIPPVQLDRDDPEVIAAKRRARETMPEFWNAYDNPHIDDDDFAIKMQLPPMPNETTESIWLIEIARRGGKVFGRIANDPIHPDFEQGQLVEVDSSQIDDWMFVRDETMHGHHLTRVMIDKAPRRIGRKMRKHFGWPLEGKMT